jgi:hypothetical protein
VNPSQIGERAEAAVVAALIHVGKSVYLPFGGSGRADMVFEDDGGLHRVQVKNGVLRSNTVRFSACSHTNDDPQDYRGQVEYLGVYCDETQSAYLIPVDAVPLRAGTLRLTPPANNQRKLIRWAQDYRLPWSPPRLILDGFTVAPDPDDLVMRNNRTTQDSDPRR